IAPGVSHTLRIVWTSTGVEYVVDGTLVAAHPVAIAGPMYVYASNNAGAPLGVDWLRVASYSPGALTYLSCVKDHGSASWGSVTWLAATPPATTVNVEARTSQDGVGWSAWVSLSNGSPPPAPTNRYLQYRVTLGTGDPSVSPEVTDVTVR
ncbi:MAG: hypothetical protein IT305_21750, partial [Chloroflexi bacterium]|nr:hypothetical protein [Chloroflexota bacterium]